MENKKLIKYEGLSLRVGELIKLTAKLLPQNSRQIKILHFDDHALFLSGVREVISKKKPNMTFVPFTDGKSALSFFKTNLQGKTGIDLVITGLNQPTMSGYQFAREIRIIEEEFKIRVPILLITMFSMNSIIAKGFEEKLFDKYLSKNVSSEEIISAIESLLH